MEVYTYLLRLRANIGPRCSMLQVTMVQLTSPICRKTEYRSSVASLGGNATSFWCGMGEPARDSPPVLTVYRQAHCCCTQYDVFTICECLLVLSVMSTARHLPRNTVSNFRQTNKVRELRAATCIVRTQCHASVHSAPAIGINVYRPILTTRSISSAMPAARPRVERVP